MAHARLPPVFALCVVFTALTAVMWVNAEEPVRGADKVRAWPMTAAPLSEVEIPNAESDRPTLDDWKEARRIQPTRVSLSGRRCRAYVVREWLKVHCDHPLAEIQQIAGPSKDALLWVNTKEQAFEVLDQGGGEVIFRLQKGLVSSFEFRELMGGDYDGVWARSLLVVEASWLSHQDQPRVIIR